MRYLIILFLLIPSLCFASAEYDQVDDFFSASDSATLDIDDDTMSFSVWVKATNDQDGQSAGVVFGKMAATDDDAYRLIYNPGTPEYRFRLDTVNGSVNADTSGVTFSANTWHHVCGRYDGSNMYLYFDNVQHDNPAQTGNVTTNNEALEIGREVGGTTFWEGQINELYISDADIGVSGCSAMYSEKIKRNGVQLAECVAYYAFDNGQSETSADGDTEIDLCGNGNTATGDDGGNNTGLTWKAEQLLSYP